MAPRRGKGGVGHWERKNQETKNGLGIKHTFRVMPWGPTPSPGLCLLKFPLSPNGATSWGWSLQHVSLQGTFQIQTTVAVLLFTAFQLRFPQECRDSTASLSLPTSELAVQDCFTLCRNLASLASLAPATVCRWYGNISQLFCYTPHPPTHRHVSPTDSIPSPGSA